MLVAVLKQAEKDVPWLRFMDTQIIILFSFWPNIFCLESLSDEGNFTPNPSPALLEMGTVTALLMTALLYTHKSPFYPSDRKIEPLLLYEPLLL
jgi:hypothetical protein